MLTEKQCTLLQYITRTIDRTGVCPTYKECAEALGIPAKSGVHRMVNLLEERGFIQRMPGRPRAMRVLRRPEDASAPPPSGEGLAKRASRWEVQTSLPHYGTVSAGTPVSEVSAPGRYADVPGTMVGEGQHFLLDLTGPSLEGIHIVHGDRLLFRESTKAREGAVVFAVVDGELAYVAEKWSRGVRTLLQIPHPDHEDLLLEPDRVDIRGVLAGVLRDL